MGNTALPQEIALYVRLGLTPIPLKPRSKRPLVRWGNGWNPTREELERWFANHTVNVGVLCGEALAVIDCDSEETFRDFTATHDLPPDCPVVKTARGYHIWVKPRKPLRSQRVDGVEIKCLGSYIVAPPSIHPSGTPYTFDVAPNGALPDVDLEQVFGSALTPPRTKEPRKRPPLDTRQRRTVERIVLEYLPGAHYEGKELAGYLDTRSESKAHVKINLEKGVFMDWRKGKGGTVAGLLRLLGAPIPAELGGMGEDDIPEYFPIWAITRDWRDEWQCGEPVVLFRNEGVPFWSGPAYCLQWSCPECAIRLKNIIKRRLRKANVCAIYRGNGATQAVLARAKRGDTELQYLRLKGRSEYVLVNGGNTDLPLQRLDCSQETMAAIVDELPYADLPKRHRRLIPSRGFWHNSDVGVNSKTLQQVREKNAAPNNAEQAKGNLQESNTINSDVDMVVLMPHPGQNYQDIANTLSGWGYGLREMSTLGESHRLSGTRRLTNDMLAQLGEVLEIRKLRGPPADEPNTRPQKSTKQPATVTATIGRKPAKPCHACGSNSWWQAPWGAWLCGPCHPDPRLRGYSDEKQSHIGGAIPA